MNTNEKLNDLLSATPSVPEDLFAGVEKGIRRHSVRRSAFITLLCASILGVGAMSLSFYSSENFSQPSVASDSSDSLIYGELERAYEFLNGEIEDHVDDLAFIDPTYF